MTNLKPLHDAAIARCKQQIADAIETLATESEAITGQQFDRPLWRDSFPELLNDCLMDATNKLDSDESERAWREDALERLADMNSFYAGVL